jgi:hypothetical protein
MDVNAAARRWVETLRDTWPRNDIEPFVALYREDARYRDLPRRDGESAAEHMRRVYVLGDPGPEVWVGEPLVAGGSAVVDWWAVITLDGSQHTFSGTTWVRFDDDGLIADEHDTWMRAEGRIEPWPGWGEISSAS